MEWPAHLLIVGGGGVSRLVVQLVVRVLPTSIRVPLGRGFELSWRRKKRAVRTCRNNTYEWDPPEER